MLRGQKVNGIENRVNFRPKSSIMLPEVVWCVLMSDQLAFKLARKDAVQVMGEAAVKDGNKGKAKHGRVV